MLVQTKHLKWPMEMHDEHEVADAQRDRVSCFPTSEDSPADDPPGMTASLMKSGEGQAQPSLMANENPPALKQTTQKEQPGSNDDRKRSSMGLREEVSATHTMTRAVKRRRQDMSISDTESHHMATLGVANPPSDTTDRHLGMPSDVSRQFLSGAQRASALSSLDTDVLPLHLQLQAQDRADLALGINAARNAAMFASLSGQTQNSHLDPFLLASSRFAGAGGHTWQLGNPFAPAHGLFAQGAAAKFASPFVEQEHAALLRLNALQGNISMLEAPSRLGVSLGASLFQNPLSGGLLRQTQPSADPLAGGLLASVYGGVGGSLGGSMSGVQDLLSSSSETGREKRGSGSLRVSGTRTSLAGERQVPSPLSHLPLPQNDDVAIAHYRQRQHVPLATDEDQNWLSEFLCFVRLELVEIFRANSEDVRSRNSSKKVFHGQVGIRCRYCAHLPLSSRASRSSSYPSSLSRIYQSLTMMLRDHFGKCNAIPLPLKQRFLELKGKTSQGATDSKHYWVYSAMKRGLVDSQSGIWVRDSSPSGETDIPPFGTSGPQTEARATSSVPVTLVAPDDRHLVSEFLYTLMTQVQRVTMEESERTGNRKSLSTGLPGVGCRHCCQSNRKGLCRLFPVRRRTLPNKIIDLYEHIRRCTLCPAETKDHLALLRQREAATERTAGEKEFFDRIWARMGHGYGHADS